MLFPPYHVVPGNQPHSQGAKVKISSWNNQSPTNNQVMRSQQNRSKLDFGLHHQRSPLRTKHRGPELQRVLRAPPAVRGLRAYRAGQVADLGPHPPPPSPLHAALCSSLTLPWMQETSPRELWLLCIQLSSSVSTR